MDVRYEPLDEKTVADIVCCPGGLEVSGKAFRGDLSETVAWRKRLIGLGMNGIVAYDADGPRGFAEVMPAETAPLPIEAPGSAALMCYHWAGTAAEDPEHLAMERELVERAIGATRDEFDGLVTQGWDVPTHFPIPFLEDLGFIEVARHGFVALMWRPFAEGAVTPSYPAASYAPRDLSSDSLLAIDAAFTARCPYSLSSEARLSEAVAEHSLREQIRLTLHRIDTREDAMALAVPPFDWAWVFFNGDEVELFELPGAKLAEEITRRIDDLS